MSELTLLGDHDLPHFSRSSTLSRPWLPILLVSVAVGLGFSQLGIGFVDAAIIGCGCAVLISGIVAASRHRTPMTYIVVGEPAESAIVSALLSLKRRPSVTILREATMSDALARCATTPAAAIIFCGTVNRPSARWIGVAGRHVPVLFGSEIAERVLRRLPLDVIETNSRGGNDAGELFGGTSGYRIAKRIIDVVGAVVLGIVLLPVMVAVAFLIRWTMHGPIVRRQPRVGLDGRPFTMYSFWTGLSTSAGIGRSLRALHLDVLPTLWNILRGDMSFVGPRPEHPDQVTINQQSLLPYTKRHLVKPGIISWAQVRFRYADTPRDTRLALEYDLYYVKHVSAPLDARIVVRGLILLVGDIVRFSLVASKRIFSVIPRSSRSLWALTGYRSPATSAALPWNLENGPVANMQATLVAGAGEGGKFLVRELRRNPSWGYWPVGFVDDDQAKVGTRVEGLFVLGPTMAIPAVVRREQIDAVVVAIPSAPEFVVNRIAELARETPARILSMPHLGDLLRGDGHGVILQSVKMTDVLGRPVVTADTERCAQFITGRRVLVTGAAGSIGREVARQVANLNPELLIGLDINESDLFDLQQELSRSFNAPSFRPVVTSIANRERMRDIFATYRPDIVFHAAAYKHVPMMEEYPQEAVIANTIGSYETALVAAEHKVKRFVLVSTDKAVRPSSVMGATKRLAELAVRAVADQSGMSVCAVRFGNVLGSRGSVIPLFEQQIAAGGPITVTHPEVRRYFMTIPEAAGLIIQAGAFGDRGVIYMLDMGEEILIRDLAERMIRLHGLRPGKDIEIVYTGMRRGEKLREDLALEFETAHPTAHSKIRVLHDAEAPGLRSMTITRTVEQLVEIARCGSPEQVRQVVMRKVQQLDGSVHELTSIPIPAEEMTHVG